MLKGSVGGGRELDARLGRVGDDVSAGAVRADAGAADRAVQEMRLRVPRDRGELFNGITTRPVPGGVEIEASAVREGFDYARAVEFGRHGVVTTGFFDRSGGGQYDVEAEPFFFPGVEAGLSGREAEMDGAIDAAADRGGFR